MNAHPFALRLLTGLLLCAAVPVAAQTAYLRTANGNWTSASGWSPAGIPGPGDTVDLNGRSVTLDTTTSVAVLIFPPVVHSVLGGAAALTVTDTLRWEAGQSNLTDTLTVGPEATFRARGVAILRMGTGGVLVNRGRMVWETPQRWRDVGRLVNEGEIEIPLDATEPAQLCFSNENPAITNTPVGLIRRTGPGTVYFSCGFNNDGAVRVEQGTFELRGFNDKGGTDTGAYEVAAGATLIFGGGVRTMTAAASITGAGTVEARSNGSGNSLSLTGTYDVPTTRLLGPGSPRFNLNADVTMPVLEMTGGFLGGNGTVTVTDAMVWTGGRMDGSGTTIIQPDVALDGANVSLNDSRTLRLEGTTTWSGEVDLSNGNTTVTVVNAGTVHSTGAGERSMFAGIFRNEGLLVHDTGLLRFNAGFENTGEVQVNGGTLNLQGYNATGGTDTGRYVVAEGGRLEFTGGNRLLTADATMTGAGTVVTSTAAFTNHATWKPGSSPGTLTVESSYRQSASGVLEIEIGGHAPGTEHDQLSVTGTATLGGTLRIVLVDGFTPQEGDRFLILPAGAVTGTFATLDLPEGLEASVATTAEGVELVVGMPVTSEEAERLPLAFRLHPAAPNPFAARAALTFDLPEPARVRLTVYDLLGREVAVLADEDRAAGRHEALLDGHGLPGGVYLVRLETGGIQMVQKVTRAR